MAWVWGTGCGDSSAPGADAAGDVVAHDAGSSDGGGRDARPDADTDGPAGDAPSDGAADTSPTGDASAGCAKLNSPAAVLTTYPAAYAGDLAGESAELSVDEATCTFDLTPSGLYLLEYEEQVVRLDNLAVGVPYAVTLEGSLFRFAYVVTGCSGSQGPAPGECQLVFDGSWYSGGYFDALSSTAYVVVEALFSPPTPPSSTYELYVNRYDCETHWDCLDPGLPRCTRFACVSGPSDCVGDDSAEDGDDGPAGASLLSPAPGAPDTAAGAICSSPYEVEFDYFRLSTPGQYDVVVTLSWADASDLDLALWNETGQLVGVADSTNNPEVGTFMDLRRGVYYVTVKMFSPVGTAAATPYQLFVELD